MVPWAVLITGAVGVGGTALGAWLNGRTQTKTLRLSLDAENARARLAEKRRVYAALLAALNNYSRLGRSLDLDPSLPLNRTELNDAQARIFDAASEVIVIAPRQLGIQVSEISNQALAFTRAVQRDRSTKFPDDFYYERVGLVGELRADLGEAD